jgi:predicted DNA-binding protein
MSPRTGRPKTENPINIRTSVRLDAETDRKLNDYCEKHGITKGEAIRKGVHLLLAEK